MQRKEIFRRLILLSLVLCLNCGTDKLGKATGVETLDDSDGTGLKMSITADKGTERSKSLQVGEQVLVITRLIAEGCVISTPPAVGDAALCISGSTVEGADDVDLEISYTITNNGSLASSKDKVTLKSATKDQPVPALSGEVVFHNLVTAVAPGSMVIKATHLSDTVSLTLFVEGIATGGGGT